MFKYKTLPIGIELSKWFYETSITLTNCYDISKSECQLLLYFLKVSGMVDQLTKFFSQFFSFLTKFSVSNGTFYILMIDTCVNYLKP